MNEKVKDFNGDEMMDEDINAILSCSRVSSLQRTATKEQVNTLPFNAYNIREVFDPFNPVHLQSYKTFLETGRWEQKFHCEFPHTSVPETVHVKFALSHIDAFLKLHEFQNRTS